MRGSDEAPVMARRTALASLLGAALLLPGCFVIDELDHGSEILDKHSSKAADAKKAKEEGEAQAVVTAKKGAVDEYFQQENEDGTTRTFSPGQMSDGIVACKLAGQTQFMTRENCAARGGRS
jgi:hypothetical protein